MWEMRPLWRSLQPSQQKQELELGLPGRDRWGPCPWSPRNSHDTGTGDPQGLANVCQWTPASIYWERQKEGKMTEKDETPSILRAGNKLIKLPSAEHALPSLRKRRMTPRAELWAPRADPQTTEGNSQALKSDGVFPVGFQNCLRSMTPFLL